MINIDLTVPRKKAKLTLVQFFLMWICIFFGIAILVVLGLVLQWRYLNSIDTEVTLLSAEHDSLAGLNNELAYYENLENKYRVILDEAGKDSASLSQDISVMRIFAKELQPGMKLEGFQIMHDTVTAEILSPSDLKVQRYVEAISRSGLFSEYRSESQGSRDGSVAHKLILRKR